MLPLSDASVLVRRGDVPSTVLDDDLVMLDPLTGQYFSLNPVAAALWARLERPVPVGTLIAGLLEAYDGDPAIIAGETRAALTRLVDLGLLLVQPEQAE
ncbi:PqqD family protein [Novispirillum itersonii]|uniref:PqqD family protein n=1 Tax=Novispirillum itersonii TaxID=189 RepID=A0A7W9ZHT6_NOVIT|nr:PqqD family protein [Novispirillum itersonii]MBB6210354.1 hypothetical protein [Novispirillum itersonii]